MIYLSPQAKERIEKLRTEDGLSPVAFIRVAVTSGGCSGLSYQMDFDQSMQPDDQIFEDKGEKIVTNPRSLLYLYGSTLDFSEGLNGKGFHFINPNAARTCSCGESFSL
ncbi:MAG: iron-sulfur cluster assembly accessory protein [Sphingobacteriales bacterium]|nr:iron-sulfur cluster assembly accessory protein [Sphingobacteriales bacterium]